MIGMRENDESEEMLMHDKDSDKEWKKV